MSKQAKTLEEVIERLNALTEDDSEASHSEADKLLLDALLILPGGQKIVTAYMEAKSRVGFWYA